MDPMLKRGEELCCEELTKKHITKVFSCSKQHFEEDTSHTLLRY